LEYRVQAECLVSDFPPKGGTPNLPSAIIRDGRVKQCPTCRRTYRDDTLAYCLDDGSKLVAIPDLQKTLRVSAPAAADRAAPTPPPVYEAQKRSSKWPVFLLVALLLVGLLAGGIGILIFGYSRMATSSPVTNDEPRGERKPESRWSPPPSPSPSLTPSPSPTPRTAEAIVGNWRTNVHENGRNTEITVTFLANGTTRYVFQERGQTTTDTATWQYSDGTLFERFSSGAAGKGSIRWIDADEFEITIIDNGVPAYNGLKRRYRRIS
jgi:hypothetical protein